MPPPARCFAGKVVRVAPALEPESRAVAVEAELPNGDGRLMPGMYCRVRLSLGSLASALLVPLRALVDDPARDKRRGRSRSAVYVVEGDRARLKKITLGAIDQGQGEVLDGLEEGQRVVVEGRSALSDGARVRVVEAPQSRPAR